MAADRPRALSAPERANEVREALAALSLPSLRPARSDDREAVVELLSMVFAQDPIIRWIVGDDPTGRRRQAFFRMCFHLRDLDAGEVLVTQDGQAAFLWNLSETSHAGLAARARQVPNFLGFADWTRIPRLLAFFDALEAHRPPVPHVYVQFLGVAPALRRSGIGGALMRCATFTADRLGRPSYGETSRPVNVSVWGRSGFDATGPAPLLPGTPPLWQLRRPVPSR